MITLKEEVKNLGNVDLNNLNVIVNAKYDKDQELIEVHMSLNTIDKESDQYNNNANLVTGFYATPKDFRKDIEAEKNKLVQVMTGTWVDDTSDVKQKFYIPKQMSDKLFVATGVELKPGQQKQTQIGYAVMRLLGDNEQFADEILKLKEEVKELKIVKAKEDKEDKGQLDG